MHWSLRVIVVLCLATTLAACTGSPRQHVRLAEPIESAAGQRFEEQPRQAATPLRIAVASLVSPRETFRSYRGIITYIGSHLSRSVQLVQRSTYREVNALVRSGQVDLAFVSTLPYVEGRREFGMELLAAPVVRGRAEYYSDIIVPADSRARSLEDLRGGVFAFSDPLSNSGWLAPTYQLWEFGETPDTFFQRVIYTFSHDNSLQAVADGLADGAAVDSLVYDSSVERSTELARRLRVITRLGPFATPPVVVNPALPAERKAALQAILLQMHEDPEGQRILAHLDIDRFTQVDDRAYDTVRVMRDALAKAEQAPR